MSGLVATVYAYQATYEAFAHTPPHVARLILIGIAVIAVYVFRFHLGRK